MHHNNRHGSGGAGGDSRQQDGGRQGARGSSSPDKDTHDRRRRGSNSAAKVVEGGWVQVPPQNAEGEAAVRLGLVAAGTLAEVGAQNLAGEVSLASARADIPACRALSQSSVSIGGRVIHGSFSGGRYAGAPPDAALAARPVAGGSGSGATGEHRRRCSVGELAGRGPPGTMFKTVSSFNSRLRRGSYDPLGAALLVMRGAGANPFYSDSRQRMVGNLASGGATAGNSSGGTVVPRPPRYSSLQQHPALLGYGAATGAARPDQRGEMGLGPRRLDIPAVRQLQRGGNERQWQSFSAYGDATAIRNAGARAPLSSKPQLVALGGGRPQVRPEDSSRRRESAPDIEVACDPPAGVRAGTAVGGLAPLSSDSEGEADVNGAHAGATSGSDSGGSSAALRRPPLTRGGPSRNASSLPGAVQGGSNAPLELLDAAAVRAQRQQGRQQRHAADAVATVGALGSPGPGQRPHSHGADEVWRTADGEASIRRRGDAGVEHAAEGEEESRRSTSSQMSDDDEEIAAIARAAANELAKNRSYRHTGDVYEDEEQEDEAATELVEPGSDLAHRARRGSRSILKKPASINRRASEAAGESGRTDTEPGSTPGARSDSHVAVLSLEGAWDQDGSGHGPGSDAHESTAVEALGGGTDCERGRTRDPGGGGGKRPRSLSKSVSFRGVDGDSGGDGNGGQADGAQPSEAAAAAGAAR
eukprot:XP_001699904.1 predicted protein [Chlamydomonas reinhardtii]